MQISHILKRLRKDFQLSIITLMGVLGIIAIAPYAIYRFSIGNAIVGGADSIVVLSTIVAVHYAWRTGDTVKPGIFLCFILSSTCTLIAINLGINGLFWIYPMILFNFFMVSPTKALIATASVLSILVAYQRLHPQGIFESDYQMMSFLVTSLMAGMVSFIFAYRTNDQRIQLQLLASQDPLTGASNRRCMNDELNIAAANLRRHGISYGVLVMDLDHFKKINDNHGHHVGDQVLIDFVNIIKAASRKEDRLFRFGGEEFLLLLPNTKKHGLQSAARHLHQQVSLNLKSPSGAVTVSIGGAIQRPDERWQEMLQRADERLYLAKSTGRNCIVIEDDVKTPERLSII
ncbi:GGDEF domain-containing protein [Pseudomonas sp. 5P_3.1_Bac2]|uniref:GGDEF domain-containing protein n=1 Tax=Pseudomonas sp. 5P_3.1_Bac2 TaxID=2971617 RepID=UPI0021C6B8B6|nr:GGDEF domain-containing protein [Pseudomonas sp. 5P_3.1_Bac2]MCU1715772.1 GGDEF domain-containing protein [Pseudomonas sp. 5P_3.1_Bac2]